MILTELANKYHILHIIYSLILIFGLNQLGTFIFKIEPISNVIGQISDIKYQKIFISVNFVFVSPKIFTFIIKLYLLYLT